MSRSAKILLAGAAMVLLLGAGGIAFGLYWSLLNRSQDRALQKASDALAQRDFGTAFALFDKAFALHLTAAKAAWVYSARGYAETETGKYADAIRDYSEALRLNSENGETYGSRGYAYHLKGELDKALADYAECLRYDENAAWVYFNRGLIYSQRKEWAKAAEDFNECVRCEPKNSYAYFRRGAALLELHDLDGALASFDSAISINSDLAEAYSARARIHQLKGDTARADADALHAMQLAPRVPAINSTPRRRNPNPLVSELRSAAQVAQISRRYDEAIDLCNKALEANPNNFQTSIILDIRGSSYAGKGDWDRALRDYEEAVRLEPTNADALTNRGNAYAHKNELAKSTSDYNEAIRLNPKLFQAFVNRALNYLAANDLERALADLNEAIRLNPKFAPAYTRRVRVLLRLKRSDEALKDADTAVSLSPETAEPYYSRARLRADRREYLQARDDYQHALEHFGNGESTLLNAAAWFFATCPDKACRDGKRAVDLATKACEMREWKDPEILDTLAAAFAEVGDFDQAIKRQSEALKLHEKSDDIGAGMQKRMALFEKHQPYHQENP
ncbi:MAG TPA: tetratricopeptide repeat protein [Chthoniobacterales bacterium]|nr:tetratricopeptide repeat protein [Chthoniobacterales bacterium]